MTEHFPYFPNMNPANDPKYELSNNQRKFFGLHPVENGWERLLLSNTIVAYLDRDRIVKILDYSWGYLDTTHLLSPSADRSWFQDRSWKTTENNHSKKSLDKGIRCSIFGSFLGENIHVYDDRRTYSLSRVLQRMAT